MKFKISLNEERIYCKRIFNKCLSEQNKTCYQPYSIAIEILHVFLFEILLIWKLQETVGIK